MSAGNSVQTNQTNQSNQKKLETKVFQMRIFSTLTFLHIYSYLKIYGVINVNFCVNCKQFSFSGAALFYRVYSVTENHQVCEHCSRALSLSFQNIQNVHSVYVLFSFIPTAVGMGHLLDIAQSFRENHFQAEHLSKHVLM